jgi:hypothetical protein
MASHSVAPELANVRALADGTITLSGASVLPGDAPLLLTSRAEFQAEAGREYFIAVDGIRLSYPMPIQSPRQATRLCLSN